MSLPAFAGVLGHEAILDVLGFAAARPAPGYLFYGPDGVGKRTVAERFARVLLDHQSEATLDSHPDFMRLLREEDKHDVSIDQVRELIRRMQMTSARGGRRVALVERADQLNANGVNALLKLVEEPGLGLVFLFVTEQPDAIPATLCSRLTQIAFNRVSEAAVRSWLHNLSTPDKYLERAVACSRGCPGLAQRYLNDPETCEARIVRANQIMQALPGPVGVLCGVLERTMHEIESSNDPEAGWRQVLAACMQQMQSVFATQPEQSVRNALGLIHAWKLSGTTLSPRIALEWSALRPPLTQKQSIASFLQFSYL